MRGYKKDYEKEILDQLSSGPMDGSKLRLSISGMESKYWMAIQNLIESNKVKKESSVRNKSNYSLMETK